MTRRSKAPDPATGTATRNPSAGPFPCETSPAESTAEPARP